MIDPSDREARERLKHLRRYRAEREGFKRKNERNLQGMQFVAIGAFATGMSAGYFHYWVLPLLWRPAISVLLFALCYLAFLKARAWYALRPFYPERTHEDEERKGDKVWLPLGLVLGALVFSGSWVGLAACAAGIAVATWLFVYWWLMGTLWKHYAYLAMLLLPSSIVPPALNLPDPNLFAVFFLGALGVALIATGSLDHRLHNQIQKGKV